MITAEGASTGRRQPGRLWRLMKAESVRLIKRRREDMRQSNRARREHAHSTQAPGTRNPAEIHRFGR
eukprot:9889930-Prorocentrum_lima.AAC.1